MSVESNEDKKSVAYLRQLGLATDEITAYLFLLTHGPQTVLSLSRGIKTGRTKLYPLLEQLASRNLVTIQERHYGTTYKAASPSSLEFLVAEQESQAATLRAQLPAVLDKLNQNYSTSSNTAQITEFTALEDIKQLYLDIMEATNEYRILELPSVKKQIGRHYIQKIESLRSLKPLILTNQRNPATPAKYLDPQLFKIEQQIIIYDQTVVIINAELHATKIQSAQVAQTYKKMFDSLYLI